MIAGLFDSHCHLDLEPLGSRLAECLAEGIAAGVEGYVVPGVHPDGWDRITGLTGGHSAIYPAYGIHPMHAGMADRTALDRLKDIAPHGVAIGEIGLDPGYGASLELQEQAFREQLRIAAAFNMPVLVHCRRVFERVARILREERAERIGGIMHAYSGSVEMAHEFIRLGFVISVSGSVTWCDAFKPQRLAGELPLEHLVLETDAPDMTPQRYRGYFNRPAWITETALRIAALRRISPEEVAGATTVNAGRILRIPTQPMAGMDREPRRSPSSSKTSV